MRAEGVMNYVGEKFSDEREIKMRGENVMNYVVQKLKELLLAIENFGGYLLEKFDELFPPDTRKDQIIHWIKVAVPYIALFVALIILFCFCKCCIRCCCRGSRRIRMMKAPGRDMMMPRHVFEADPRSYFLDLRGK